MSDVALVFQKLNNAVLDLQGATVQTYERHLRTVARLLDDAALKEVNRALTNDLDFDAFLSRNDEKRGFSEQLEWPDDARQCLGISLLLIKRFGNDSKFIFNFGHRFYSDGSVKLIHHVRNLTSQLVLPFARDYKDYVLGSLNMSPLITERTAEHKIFIVHGHDGEAKERAARFISAIGFKPIILHEQANRGMMITEKIEAHSDVGFAIVLLTPDDQGRSNREEVLGPRARQNVLLELGYFLGRLGRPKVCALKRGEVDIPSDFAGTVWEVIDDPGAWKQALGRELVAAGYAIDWNKVMAA